MCNMLKWVAFLFGFFFLVYNMLLYSLKIAVLESFIYISLVSNECENFFSLKKYFMVSDRNVVPLTMLTAFRLKSIS